ncbi:MAG: hypothetical protein NXH75_10945, partial [Halobacteriovoraceae bacterium]|nr:hypothetical protein [Halobacteriovoraceae bacterium]
MTRTLNDRVIAVVKELADAPPLGKDLVKEKLLQFVRELAKQENGLSSLYQMTPKIVEAGFFTGGGWEREDKLLPELVRGSFVAGGLYPYIEIISELRILCIANNRISSQYLSQDEAKTFLTEMMALNLDILFDTVTEENRVYAQQFKIARGLLSYLTDSLDIEDLFDEYSSEVLELAFQRPIITDHITALIESGRELVEKSESLKERQSYRDLELFFKSVFGPTPHALEVEHPLDYRKLVKTLDPSELEKEALNFGVLLKETGIGNIYGVILLRNLVKKAPELVPMCLGLNDSGKAHFNEHKELILN